MTEQELSGLIAQAESQNLELKDERFKPSNLAETLVAFANTNAGKVIIGVDEKTRKVAGIQKKEEVINNIHRAANPTCSEPAINISIEEVPFQGQLAYVISVPYQPIALFTTSGRVLLRRGAENIPATQNEIINLSSKRGRLRHEASPVDGARMEDLDFTLLKAYRQAYKEKRGRNLTQPDIEILKTLGSIVQKGKDYRPTVAGILVFGKNPQNLLPQSEVAIARYPGEGVTRNILDSKEFTGSLPQIIEKILQYISDHIQVASIRGKPGSKMKREDIPEYPFPALQEIITNAIAHREYQITGSRVIIKWFTNRIEVWSPGSFLEQITPETIYMAGPFHRNPNIMKALYGYGFVEAYGDGMHLIKEEFEKHPLKPPLPEFKEATGGIITTVFAAELDKVREKKPFALLGEDIIKELNTRQVKILEYTQSHKQITTVDCLKLFPEVHERTIRRDLRDLESRGLLGKGGSTKGAFYYTEVEYVLPFKG
jgi:ATP-dependent DNA helicase RecG